jgi:hypothetical protein
MDLSAFQPKVLDTPVVDNSGLFNQSNNTVSQGDQFATSTALTEAQNKQNLQNLIASRESLKRAQSQRKALKLSTQQAAQNAQNVLNSQPSTPTSTTTNGTTSFPSSSAGLPKGISSSAPETTVKIKNGMSFTINSSAASHFVGFANALLGEGYKIYSIAGYNNRPISGSATPSMHSYGLAFDINPSDNPVSYGKTITNLPANVAALAAKYGLTWGGAAQWNKEDAMHFSIPLKGYSY